VGSRKSSIESAKSNETSRGLSYFFSASPELRLPWNPGRNPTVASGIRLAHRDWSMNELDSEATPMNRTLLNTVLAAFSLLTAAALWQHGYWGIIEPHFQSFGAAQVFADLVIALTLVMTWMWRDAKGRGRNPLPWIVLTLVAGSFGPLLYFVTQPRQE
jgi:hypothetical protein